MTRKQIRARINFLLLNAPKSSDTSAVMDYIDELDLLFADYRKVHLNNAGEAYFHRVTALTRLRHYCYNQGVKSAKFNSAILAS